MSAPSTGTRLLDQLSIMLHLMNRTSPETPLIILLLTWLTMLHMQVWAGAIIQGLYQSPAALGRSARKTSAFALVTVCQRPLAEPSRHRLNLLNPVCLKPKSPEWPGGPYAQFGDVLARTLVEG